MVKCLESYGIRVQKSAFEAYLTKKDCDAMAEQAAKLIETGKDSLRIYLLANRGLVRSWGAVPRKIGHESIIL